MCCDGLHDHGGSARVIRQVHGGIGVDIGSHGAVENPVTFICEALFVKTNP